MKTRATILVVAMLLAAGCGGDDPPPRELDEGARHDAGMDAATRPRDAAPYDATGPSCQDVGPVGCIGEPDDPEGSLGCTVTTDCCGWWFVGPLEIPSWVAGPRDGCIDLESIPQHWPIRFGDPCVRPQNSSSLCDCGIPTRGAAICYGGDGHGAWGMNCESDADCPAPLMCVGIGLDACTGGPPSGPSGTCNWPCTRVWDTSECPICGTECKPDGFCGGHVPGDHPGPECEHDCECWGEYNTCSGPFPPDSGPYAGQRRCVNSGGLIFARCGPGLTTDGSGLGGTCGCVSGACELNGGGIEGCCRAPDGHVIDGPWDSQWESVCGPPGTGG